MTRLETVILLANVVAFGAVSSLVLGWAIFVTADASLARVATGFATTIAGLTALGLSAG